MYQHLRVLALAPAYNEAGKIEHVVRRMPPCVDEVVVVDDGSTDGTVDLVRAMGATVLPTGGRRGVGAALRLGLEYGLARGYDVMVVVAGNNKDAPEEIPRLLAPIAEGRALLVQGSRFLGGDSDFGAMPYYRRLATRLHPLLFSVAVGKRVTESTNGFRAIHRRVLEDPRLDLSPSWLDTYELEPYLYLRTIRLGHPTCEVPVTKRYPPKHLGQTKMRPVLDWWRILRPVVRGLWRG